MAVIEHNFEVFFHDVAESNKITNKSLLGIFAEIAGFHSNLVGYGLNDIPKTGYSWVLLNWKVKIINRPIYADTVLAKTWARNSTKFYTYRDFELFDKDNNLLAVATSKWALVDVNTMGLAKITDEVILGYNIEDKKVFENEPEPNKIDIPDVTFSCIDYTVRRCDIDVNHHVNNIAYLNIAYEVLPENVYRNTSINSFEIMYKKAAKYGDTMKCFYANVDKSHYIIMKSQDEKAIHCIIKLNEE